MDALHSPSPVQTRWRLAEARHRTANAFQILSSLIQRELNSVSDVRTVHILKTVQAQLRAFALLNDMLAAAEDDDEDEGEARLCAAAYLKRLCEHLQAACLTSQGVGLHVAAAEPQLLPELVCRYLGLIVAELVLNASKHAFPGRYDGEVGVCLGSESPDAPIRLVVADNGIGVEALSINPTRGLGFVHLMAKAIGAECAGTSSPSGTTIVVTLPATLRPVAA
jgi:two-component sensor histidine kinase